MTLPDMQALQDAANATWPAYLPDSLSRGTAAETQSMPAQSSLGLHSKHDAAAPVSLYVLPLVDLPMDQPAPTASFHIWEPLAIQIEIWAAGGMGREDIARMRCAPGPKTSLLGRREGHAVATGFAAIHDGITMVHALAVMATHRRHGTARALMLEAARWAAPLGALYIATACSDANSAARALCASVGLRSAGRYFAGRPLGEAENT